MADRSVVVRLRAEIADYQRKMAMAGATTAGFVKNLDTADSRMGNLVQTALALAPALVPLGGAGLAGVSALTAQLGFAAAGAGATALAFNGVGDALGALNDYQLEPTTENYEKLQEAMRGLGPEAREFVVFLDEITPKLQRLREEAQGELLPGVQAGLDTFLDARLPETRRVVEEISSAMGEMAKRSGEDLSSEDWDDFFAYLEREAEPNLRAFGDTVGNIVQSTMSTLMAMDPVNDQFSQGLLGWSENLAETTANLDDSEGFQDFLDYLTTNGPRAADTLGALGGALVDLIGAAAPVGAASLPLLTAAAETLSAIAESPAGPVLIGAAAGISAVSRAVALFNAANGSAMLGLLQGTSKSGAAAGKGAQAAGGGMAYLMSQVDTMKSRAQLGAAALGTLGLAFTDLDDRAGISNTAMGATMGLVAGPWGAAIGAGIGFVADFASAHGETETSIRRMNAALVDEQATFESYRKNLAGISEEAEAALSTRVPTSFGDQLLQSFTPGGIKDNLDVIMAGAWKSADNTNMAETRLGQLATEADRAKAAVGDLDLAGDYLAKTMGVVSAETSNTEISTSEWEAALQRAAPAMQALGYSVDDLVQGARDGSIVEMVDRMRNWQAEADSSAGRTDALAQAIAGLDDDMLSTADSAEALQASLDALMGPQMDVSAATDAWTAGLRDLRDELAANKTLVGQSDAALQNREAIRGQVENFQDLLVTQAAAGATTEKLTRTFAEQREALIRTGTAAGLSRGELRGFLKELGMTPRVVKMTLRATGISEAEMRVRDFRGAMDKLPKDVRTRLRAEGIPKTMGDVDALVAKYKLTERQRQALITLRDLASKDLQQVLGLLQRADRTTATPSVNANISAAMRAIGQVQYRLQQLDGQSASTTVTTTHRTVYTSSGQRFKEVGGGSAGQSANGSIYDGPVKTYATGHIDRVPQLRQGGGAILWNEPETGWEAYISGKPGMEARNKLIWLEAGRRLGMDRERRQAPMAVAGGGGSRIVVDLGNVRIRGTLDTPWGPADIEGMIDDRIQDYRGHDNSRARFQHVGGYREDG